MATQNRIRSLNRLPFDFEDGLKVKGIDIDSLISTNVTQQLSNKQDTLISGTNIKTINNTSILGSGDIVVDVGASDAADITFSPVGNLAATNVQAAVAELDTEKQDTLVSGTNIKTINNLSILGSGNIDIVGGAASAASVTFTPTGNILATNVQTALVELDNEKQSTLVSGTNIKTINNTSILGSGNINISGGAATATDVTFTPSGGLSSTNVQTALVELDSEKQVTLVSGTNIKTINGSSILGSGNIAISGGASDASSVTFAPVGNIASTSVQAAIAELDSEKQITLVSGTNIKTINSSSLLGTGDVVLQAPLVSGTTIKTINTNSLLGSGNLSVQDTLVSGTNIKTINNTSILGSGNISINAGSTAAIDVSVTPGGNISSTNVQTALMELDNEKQPTLVSGTNIKTINNEPLLGSGNLSIVAALPWIIFTSTSSQSMPANTETTINGWTTSASGGASGITLSSGQAFTLPAGTWNVSISVGTAMQPGASSYAKFFTGTLNANTTITASSSHNSAQYTSYGVTAGSGIINISAPTTFYCSIVGTGAMTLNSGNFAHRISIQKINT